MFRKFGLAAAALALGGILAVSGVCYAAKGFSHLSFMGGYMEKHPTTVMVFKPFIKASEEKFGGKLSFDYFSTNSLYPEAESFSALTDGRVDIGEVRPSLFPGKMNYLGVVAIPGMCPNAIVGSLVTEELIQKFPAIAAEFPKNTVHFTSWASAAYQLHTLKPVKTLEDIKGKKIIVWDATTLEFIKALGANPIRMSSPDTYLALSKGMADGVLCPTAPLKSYKITESAKYHLMFNLAVNTFSLETNKDLYTSMPADMQNWLNQEGGLKMALACGQSLEEGQKNDIKWMLDQGHTFYFPTDEERAALLAPLAGFVDKWQNEECRNMDKNITAEVLKFARERAAYHVEKLKAGEYGDYAISVQK